MCNKFKFDNYNLMVIKLKKYYDKFLILINKNNKIPNDFSYDLINIYSKYKNEYITLDKTVYINYLLLKKDLKSKNIEIDVESGYRTHEYQKNLFNNLVQNKGINYAKKYIAREYYSEHETGLAIDICIFKNNKYYIEHEIKKLKDIDYIHKILHKYGFILRYPENKENITGYNYEPWHIRYVGKFAKKIYEENLTLEEFHKLYLKK